jgi:hypothetical protein
LSIPPYRGGGILICDRWRTQRGCVGYVDDKALWDRDHHCVNT